MCNKMGKIIEICISTAKQLFLIYHNPNSANTRLRFPEIAGQDGKRVRVSEQEARFIFCRELEKRHDITYSVETPTSKKYSFDKKLDETECGSGRSGSIDTTIFFGEREVNVEFKAHNVDEHCVAKDLVKLCEESPLGVFFHVLENIDAGTLRATFGKYRKTFRKKNLKIPEGKCILFFICILNKSPLILYRRINSSDSPEVFDLDKITVKDQLQQAQDKCWNVLNDKEYKYDPHHPSRQS